MFRRSMLRPSSGLVAGMGENEGPLKRWYPTTTLHGATTQLRPCLEHHRRESLKTRILF